MSSQIFITTCYAFLPLEENRIKELTQELLCFGSAHQMKGLILIASEGINATVCGSEDSITEWKELMKRLQSDITFKDSDANKPIFRRWSVKVKPEIVALKQPQIRPRGKHRHLTPQEWDEMMQRGDVVVVDARNDYEVAVGKFRNAIDPGIQSFHEFPAYVREAGLPKDKKVLLYCTGGIRCEKALLAMEAEGYSDVYQLDGGILGYLAQFPERDFEGECFVFDERVAVDQRLEPSKTFRLCEGCGDPVRVADGMACRRCTSVSAL